LSFNRQNLQQATGGVNSKININFIDTFQKYNIIYNETESVADITIFIKLTGKNTEANAEVDVIILFYHEID